jgi:hypothetical protein
MKKRVASSLKNAIMPEHPVPDVLFLVFNRPSLTQTVFNAIKKSRPSRIFIAADGPRKNNELDVILCKQVRDIVAKVDWKCEIKTLFREENLGCRVAITSAIDWFFNHVDAGVILEDDCLPSDSFFSFCGLMLERYKHNDQIMQINGGFHLSKLKNFDESYYFSKINSCWGWATWARSWKNFDPDMSGYAELKANGVIEKYYEYKPITNWMISYLDEADTPSCGIWSTQWAYAILKNDGLCVNPTINMVNNIGFFDTPTSGVHESFSLYSEHKLEDISKIISLNEIVYDIDNDRLEFENIIKTTDPRLLNKGFKSLLKRIFVKIFSGR